VEPVIERKGSRMSKITMAVDRFVIKLADGLAPEQEAWLIEFAKCIDAEMRPELTQTLRGIFGSTDNQNGSTKLRMNNGEYLPGINSQKYGLPPYPKDA
jgi:hypothetical protein